MKQKSIIWLLALSLLLTAMTGCAESTQTPTADQPPETESTTTAEAATEPYLPEETEEPPAIAVAGEEYSWTGDAEFEYVIYNLEDSLYEVLLEKSARYVKIWYDQEDQVLFASVSLPAAVSENWLSTGSLTLADADGDDNDDLLISEISPEGDEYIYCFLWDPENMDLHSTPSAEYSRTIPAA